MDIVPFLFIPNLISCLFLLWVRESKYLILARNSHYSKTSSQTYVEDSYFLKELGTHVHSKAQ